MVARAKSLTETLAEAIERDERSEGAPTIRELLLAHPSFRRLIVATAVRSLGAQKWVFDRDQKKVVFYEDSSTQMKAVAFLAAYTEGLPMQTNVSLNIGDQKRIAEGDGMTIEAALRASPALRDKLAAMLASTGGTAAGESGTGTTGRREKRAEKVIDAG